jgi:hypothetical protein
MVFNRINVGGLTMIGTTGDYYFPSWMEISVSAGIISFMVLVFLFAVERFHIWEAPPREREDDPYALPEFSRAGEVWLGNPAAAARTKYSLAFILALAFGIAVMPARSIESRGVADVPSQKARGGDALFVDGNRDGFGVDFAHQAHVERNGNRESCVVCHHMNLPADQASGCYNCHYDMYRVADAFRHEWHGDPAGANIACRTCHAEGMERTAESAKTCDDCHRDLIPAGATIKVDTYMAPSYTDALHGLCVSCHLKKAAELADKPDLAMCATCHEKPAPEFLQPDMKDRLVGPHYNHVVLPSVAVESK